MNRQKIIFMSEDEFDMIAKNTFDNEYTQNLVEQIRSRPHIPPPQKTDFANVEINDWIAGVGDITTEYEKNFIRRYGQREATIRTQERNATLDDLVAKMHSLSWYIDSVPIPAAYVFGWIESLRPHTTAPVPNSHELSEMAKNEWSNREERRGIHNKEDWCSGWISGFLTPSKPDWTKEREATIRNATLDEPRDCATCNNKQNAAKYVKRMNACSMRVHMKKRMDDLKECCPECRCNGEFKFDEKKCRGYNGNCNQSSCNDFCWWHAKCNCKIIREHDEQKNSIRTPTPKEAQQR